LASEIDAPSVSGMLATRSKPTKLLAGIPQARFAQQREALKLLQRNGVKALPYAEDNAGYGTELEPSIVPWRERTAALRQGAGYGLEQGAGGRH